MSKVLVTGGSGFIGAHCILQLLEAGHEVRTTVRNLVPRRRRARHARQGRLDGASRSADALPPPTLRRCRAGPKRSPVATSCSTSPRRSRPRSRR